MHVPLACKVFQSSKFHIKHKKIFKELSLTFFHFKNSLLYMLKGYDPPKKHVDKTTTRFKLLCEST